MSPGDQIPPPSGQVVISLRCAKIGSRESRTSWITFCTQRSNTHKPTRLPITPAIRPKAATKGGRTIKKSATAIAMQSIWELMDHNPARTTPILAIRMGPSNVAEISNATETVRMNPIWVELYPTDKRYVTICPANERTVK